MNHKGPLGQRSQLRRKRAVKTLLALLLVATAGVSFADEVSSAERLDPDTMEARVAACIHCHGSQGRAGPDGFYPRIAGKPGGYLLAQLQNFRDGRRSYEPMRHLLQGLPDEYLGEIAGYFADMRLPYAAPTRVTASAALLEQGRTLAELGDPVRKLPACISCATEPLIRAWSQAFRGCWACRATTSLLSSEAGEPDFVMPLRRTAWRKSPIN